MEIKYFEELKHFIENELVFTNNKVNLTMVDIMRLCEAWSKEKKRLEANK